MMDPPHWKASELEATLTRLGQIGASSVVARARLASPGLNAALRRRLAARPGTADALLADPIFETARTWKTADRSLEALAGGLLHPRLVDALDGAAEPERMSRDTEPWSHQLAAWEAARDGVSCLVTAGTGAGKTECFMVPILDDLLREPIEGLLSGVRAIIVYPLNALIASQRQRLAAWTEPLADRFRFALYNGLTPEQPRQERSDELARAELGHRRAIRETPPAILVTNVTMLEYLLLRTQDRPILEGSQGRLRWIVLDEAHGYIGAQAAEMALLLRRVRAAFGVAPEQVRLMATSATIGEGADVDSNLKRYTADLAGVAPERVQVIRGHETHPALPPVGADDPLLPDALAALTPNALWTQLAPHPRLQELRARVSDPGAKFAEVAEILFGPAGEQPRAHVQAVLDAAARAKCPQTGMQLIPWRAHIFYRALGGIWACTDPRCPHQDAELAASGAGWDFGAVWLSRRDRCECGAPAFEVVACTECGTPQLVAACTLTQEDGRVTERLRPLGNTDTDDFALDAEPDEGPGDSETVLQKRWVLSPGRGGPEDVYLKLDDGTLLMTPPAEGRWAPIVCVQGDSARTCCSGASTARLAKQWYGPPFFMGSVLPSAVETLARPHPEPGLPMGGRRALTFSDSRQGTARLAAKLQQDAERRLTRAFLYHAVQEDRGPTGAARDQDERTLAELKAAKKSQFEGLIKQYEDKLSGIARPIPWNDLVNRFADQVELRDFATAPWRGRGEGGREMADDPRQLARMFLYRELARRPAIQNNAETMGLVRLSFPDLEERARTRVPTILDRTGINMDGWVGLALASVDFVFRQQLATSITPDWMLPFVRPRSGRQSPSVCSRTLMQSERPPSCRPWPGPVPHSRPTQLQRLVYLLIQGDPKSTVDQDRADEVLEELWRLVTSTAARDIGRGAWQLDLECAAVVRLDAAWFCPVTRRLFGYSPAGRTPYDPERRLEPVRMPRLPMANPGGPDRETRDALTKWCATNTDVVALRERGLWTDLHDRAAAYPPFLRAQEHSGQIPRPVLGEYEKQFKDGRINLLNSSTTMEMGIDIPNVQLVVNANVPPSVSNYRQRLGRAGRRGEPWAFGITFCRDSPLDRTVFENPGQFIRTPVTPPSVRLDSPAVIGRHVNAWLLGAFLRNRPEGFQLRASTGAFFGATDDTDCPVAEKADADAFLDALQDPGHRDVLGQGLAALIRGTAFDGREAAALCDMTAVHFEELLHAWRREYRQLVERREAAQEPEVKNALGVRARRMRGEFLLGELAARGFTPAYGFPVDVVAFDHLVARINPKKKDDTHHTFGLAGSGSTRPLDIAIREYAPGAEIVLDGMVHRAEGLRPAWDANADKSGLEDLQCLWECKTCRAFGLMRLRPEACPDCDGQDLTVRDGLRPAGFLGGRQPHTGYENLGHVPYERPRLSASGGSWCALPDPVSGRLRVDPRGRVVTKSSGLHGHGYAICLDCGRAQAETEAGGARLPEGIRRHVPLAIARGAKTHDGYCSGGFLHPARVLRRVRLVHEARTDVFELQLPASTTRETGLAVAAGLREALAEQLGAEADEIGAAHGPSRGSAEEARVSAYLYDRAAGGAGLASRLTEPDWFERCLIRACERLECSQDCENGCPACVMRPDLNFEPMDRAGGLKLAKDIRRRHQLPAPFQVFGPDTRLVDGPLTAWLRRHLRSYTCSSVAIYLHGATSEWDLDAWRIDQMLVRLKDTGAETSIVFPNCALTDAGMTLVKTLGLYRLASQASVAIASDLPLAGGKPVIALVSGPNESIAIAACAENEAVPGPDWGLGAAAVLVRGDAPALPVTKTIDTAKVVAASMGNAQMIHARDQLDGLVGGFGRAFWKLLATAVPRTIAALKQHGVAQATYVDRYLTTPLTLRLLLEVLRTMPGAPPAELTVQTARVSPSNRVPSVVFDNFADVERQAVLRCLLGDVQIDVRDRQQVSHERKLTLRLNDGRIVVVMLDQGFGAWRAVGRPRHEFYIDPSRQARAIASAKFEVRVDAGREAPIVLSERLPS